ncbi:hypothetical protein BDV97DRAFT_355842 [Delphinella strobiligena]|nr:hypothetical protein BDV97DRAFT_355842 [Delphinella strobiligena]
MPPLLCLCLLATQQGPGLPAYHEVLPCCPLYPSAHTDTSPHDCCMSTIAIKTSSPSSECISFSTNPLVKSSLRTMLVESQSLSCIPIVSHNHSQSCFYSLQTR